MTILEEIYSSTEPIGRRIQNHRAPSDWRDWCAVGNQTRDNVFQTRVFNRAVSDYQKAKAKIETPLSPGKMEYSPVGASFSMGKFLNGHPVCAFRREKTKLPPKNINVILRCPAFMGPEALSIPLVKIAKACGEYQAAGGIVTLTINFHYNFSSPLIHNGEKIAGLIITVKTPLTNPGILATVASIQMYRGLCMPIGAWASPDSPDGMIFGKIQAPTYHVLDGTPGATEAVLKALAIV